MSGVELGVEVLVHREVLLTAEHDAVEEDELEDPDQPEADGVGHVDRDGRTGRTRCSRVVGTDGRQDEADQGDDPEGRTSVMNRFLSFLPQTQ